MGKTVLSVVAAVVERDGRFLVTRRLRGTHLAGYWEFPGGKRAADESPEDGLRRELREELDVGLIIHEEMLRVSHRYRDRDLELRFFRCDLVGTPRPRLGQAMRWVSRAGLARLRFPPADADLIDRLRADA